MDDDVVVNISGVKKEEANDTRSHAEHDSVSIESVRKRRKRAVDAAPLNVESDGHRVNESRTKRVCRRRTAVVDSGPSDPVPSVAHASSRLAFSSVSETGASDRIQRVLSSLFKIESLSDVQRRAFAPIREGLDVLVQSETGSGKTLAFLIPVVQNLLDMRFSRDIGTLVLIVAPTKEIALQICDVAESLTRPFPHIVVGSIQGGMKRKSEKARLRKGVTVLVGTPGRLRDHLENTSSFSCANLKCIVFDEADRLLDLGFEASITAILDLVVKQRGHGRPQSVLVSATLDKKVLGLSDRLLDDPVNISGPSDELEAAESGALDSATPAQLTQQFVVVPEKLRLVVLASLLRWISRSEHDSMKAIVFFSTIAEVEYFSALLERVKVPVADTIKPSRKKEGPVFERLLPEDVPVISFHGSVVSQERADRFKSFQSMKAGILLATDVAARGIDLPDVGWVVQYSVPTDPSVYAHRAGRTCRLGRSGRALVFVRPSERGFIGLLEGLGLSLNEMQLVDVLCALGKGGRSFREQSFATAETATIQHVIEELVEENGRLKDLAVSAFESHIRAYATHGKQTKPFCNKRELHLGHVATGFGLRDVPSGKGRPGKRKAKKSLKSRGEDAVSARRVPISEFD